MAQNIQKISIKFKKILLVLFVFLLSLFIGKASFAQQLPPFSENSLDSQTAQGTPISEIVDATNSGGLVGIKDPESLIKPTEVSANVGANPIVDQPPIDVPALAPLTTDSLSTLETQGGISSKPQPDESDPTIFKLAVRFLEKVIFHGDTEFASKPVFDNGMDISGTPTFDQDTAGYAIIGKGSQSVAVDFDNKYDMVPVVTATLSLQQYKDKDVQAAAEDLLLVSDVKYIVADVSKNGFQIMMDRVADSDIPFSWHAIAVREPKVSKKEGDKLSGSIAPDANSASDVPASASGSSQTSNPASASHNASDFSLTGESSSQDQGQTVQPPNSNEAKNP